MVDSHLAPDPAPATRCRRKHTGNGTKEEGPVAGVVPAPEMELLMGFEPMTSSLPRRCSTTELQQHGRRRSGTRLERAMGIEPTQPAWKAGALPLSYARNTKPRLRVGSGTVQKSEAPPKRGRRPVRGDPDGPTGGQNWIRTSEGIRHQIYSLTPLAAWVSAPRTRDPPVRAPPDPSPRSGGGPKGRPLELAMGLEPITSCLQDRSSTS